MFPKFYEFTLPGRIISGLKSLDRLPAILKQLSLKKPLIVTDQGVEKAGLVNIITSILGGANIPNDFIYDKVPQDSSKKVVTEIAKLYNDSDCDSLIAIGGGSVIDSTKAANILVTEKNYDLMAYAGADILTKSLQPMIAIPTTAGTGSEVTGVAVIKDHERHIKMGFSSEHMIPKVAILDPRMTMTLPPQITAATAMDALTHAIEAYTCLQKNPLSDSFSLKAIQLINENLIPVLENPTDLQKRLNMANGACLAGIALANSIAGVVHTMGHAIGGVCNVPHGVAMNIFLPHGLEFNKTEIKDRLQDILLVLIGSEDFTKIPTEERADELIRFIKRLRDHLYSITGLPRNLKEANVPEEKFPEIIKVALDDGSVAFNPVELTPERTYTLLEKAY